MKGSYLHQNHPHVQHKWRAIVSQLVMKRVADDRTQGSVARELNLTDAALAGWENHRNRTTAMNFIAWADALGYDVVLQPKQTEGETEDDDERDAGARADAA